MPFFPPSMEPPPHTLPSRPKPEMLNGLETAEPPIQPFLAVCPAHPSGNSPAETPPARVRIKNRRRRYLHLHPSYFSNPNLELANPLLYDRLIRSLQSAAEREAEGRKKGFAGVLEADLCRAEAKVASLSSDDQSRRGRTQQGTVEDVYEAPETKEEGQRRWREAMEMRFVAGDDEDFDYSTVDNNEAYDDRTEEDRDSLDVYLQGEEPEFVLDEGKSLEGETGIQDY